uniref:Uncharacterized protein n=1 Tax=Trichogramma kaykai TaxID=54128 RepID=A0ABD2XI88_9HYME
MCFARRKRDDRMPAWARARSFRFRGAQRFRAHGPVLGGEDRYSIVERFSCNFSCEDYKTSVVCQNLNSVPYDFFFASSKYIERRIEKNDVHRKCVYVASVILVNIYNIKLRTVERSE